MPEISHVINEQIPPDLRLDRYVSEILRLFSRSQIKARNARAKVNGKDVKFSRFVKRNDVLELFWDDFSPEYIIPQPIPLEIIYEDERCVVISKAQGMVVHPGAGNRQGTMANALYFRMMNRNLSDDNINLRSGIVHRLDKETSGVIIAAYDEEAHAFLAHQFKTRRARKTYIAIVQGVLKERTGRIETFLSRDPKDRRYFSVSSAGKKAVTFYKTVKIWKNHCLVLLRPKTGRTHQLRVHLKYLGNPIMGDPVYGGKDKIFPEANLMLHSRRLEITLPGESQARVFSSAVPQRFIEIIKKLDRLESGNGN
ncbi:MAG: RluA family pseudouridine synthase [Treponema sp.]|nr:RluA family pseudouridine synthase [Treponema sp.]MCL2271425.1 RluA family pseudouridine synthase [Treponema sp.]